MLWGLAAAIGIPVVVGVLTVAWPEHAARRESVYDIQERAEREKEESERANHPGLFRRGPDSFVTDQLPRQGRVDGEATRVLITPHADTNCHAEYPRLRRRNP